MSLNTGVLSFTGTTIDRIDFSSVVGALQFNGGTPTDNDGNLVIGPFASGYLPQAPVGGLYYTDSGAILVDSVGSIAGHTNSGLPYTVNKGLAISIGQPAASYAPAGIPLDASGRVALT